MASAIHPHNWRQQPPAPVRRVWIAKPGTTERRPLAILPMIDRCKQVLVKLALEPEWEARFEAHSYGYRPGRGAHDAIAAILAATRRRPMYVFNADIEKAFDTLSQAVILEKLQTYPALREAITAWLKAGVIEAGTYFPSNTGIPQGGALSPLLLNVALHGMEAVVTNHMAREQPLLVRYADNFVILHTDPGILHQTTRRVRSWLSTLGLQLSAHKTHFAHTLMPFQGEVGFDFLGFHLHQEPCEKRPAGKSKQERAIPVKTITTPSQEASKRHLAATRQKLQQMQTAPQVQVIAELNPLILGWATYYNGVVEARVMSQYDELVEQQLMEWASKRHPGKTREWLLAHYWQRSGNQKRIFATPEGVQLHTYQSMNLLKES
jgi:RNA-directed DNA polymerase